MTRGPPLPAPPPRRPDTSLVPAAAAGVLMYGQSFSAAACLWCGALSALERV